MYLEKFKEMTEAYQILNDSQKRERYDNIRAGKGDPQNPFQNFKNPFQGFGRSGIDQEKLRRQFEEFRK